MNTHILRAGDLAVSYHSILQAEPCISGLRTFLNAFPDIREYMCLYPSDLAGKVKNEDIIWAIRAMRLREEQAEELASRMNNVLRNAGVTEVSVVSSETDTGHYTVDYQNRGASASMTCLNHGLVLCLLKVFEDMYHDRQTNQWDI